MYRCDELRTFVTSLMEEGGLCKEDAALFADSLLYAEMRGISSHGLTRLATYYRRVKEGMVDAKAKPRIISDLPSLMVVDNQNAMGVPGAMAVMEICIQRAKVTGCCFAAVRGGNHFGCASYFAERACKAGMMGIALANGPKTVAPTGGKDPVLGTNPMAIAIPAAGRDPFVLDMATSVVAQGKIALAAKEGRTIPEGWGLDAYGNPTTDPHAVKCLLPFGGAKGYGISLMIELLCSCLSGAKTGTTMGSLFDFSGKKQDSGFFLGAMNVGIMEGFGDAADTLFDVVKSGDCAEGVGEILIPGEKARRNYLRAEHEGIALSAPIVAEMLALADATGVPFPREM